MKKADVLKNLTDMIGTEFEPDEVICAFGNFKENEEQEVIVNTSENAGYDAIAYIQSSGSTDFLFSLDNNIITNVRIH